jgi:hypothetical protein
MKPGPKVYPLDPHDRAILIHWGLTECLTREQMAQRIKISTQTLTGLLGGHRGMKAVTQKRVLRFVARLKKKAENTDETKINS